MMGSLLTCHVNMQAVLKFAGGAKSCSEDAMVTRVAEDSRTPRSHQSTISIIVGDFSWIDEPFRYVLLS
jgi:hypothetical protein